jgi:hypothetical protein
MDTLLDCSFVGKRMGCVCGAYVRDVGGLDLSGDSWGEADLICGGNGGAAAASWSDALFSIQRHRTTRS